VTRVVILGVFLEGKEFWATVFHKAETEDIKICFDATFFLVLVGGSMSFGRKTFGRQARYKSDLPINHQLTRSRQCLRHQNIKSAKGCIGLIFYWPNIVSAKWFSTKRIETSTILNFYLFWTKQLLLYCQQLIVHPSLLIQCLLGKCLSAKWLSTKIG
jgi:hypothetical protein